MAFVGLVFVLALLGIAVLFAQKAWELRTGRTAFPALKEKTDVYAGKAKTALVRSRDELEHLPPTLMRLSASALHSAALGAASAARYVERELHRLADMASHKRNFERRETQNEFLKQVSEHKSENGTDSENGTTTV